MPYELEFEDTFDSGGLDLSRWLPYYLPHWSSRERSAARYEIRDGCLRRSRAPSDRPRPYPKEFVVDYVRGFRMRP